MLVGMMASIATNQLDAMLVGVVAGLSVGCGTGSNTGALATEIGEEGEVSPLRPQGRLASDQSGPAHDEPTFLVDALGHLV